MHTPYIAQKLFVLPTWIAAIIVCVGLLLYLKIGVPVDDNAFVVVTFWLSVLVLWPVLGAIHTRNKELHIAYGIIHAQGGLTSLEEKLSLFAEDAVDASSSTRKQSEKQFRVLHELMCSAEYEMADDIQDYLPGADLAAGKQRRTERIHREADESM